MQEQILILFMDIYNARTNINIVYEYLQCKKNIDNVYEYLQCKNKY
jgi:hypothetical protein